MPCAVGDQPGRRHAGMRRGRGDAAARARSSSRCSSQREQQVGQLGVRVGVLRVVGLADVAVEHELGAAVVRDRGRPSRRGPSPRSSSAGSSRPVSTKWPRWLVPNCSSKPSAVLGELRRRHDAGVVDQQVERAVPRLGEAAPTPSSRGRAGRRRRRRRCRAGSRSAAASPAPTSRQASTTRAPCAASSRAVWKPMPELAPVTTADAAGRGRAAVRPSTPRLRNLRALRARAHDRAARHWRHVTSAAIRTRVWRNGTLEAENFPFEQVSDYLDEPDCLVWADLLQPDHDDLLAARRGAQPRPARRRGRGRRRTSARRRPATPRTCS